MFIHHHQDCVGFWTQKIHQGQVYWNCPACGAISPDSEPGSPATRVRERAEQVLAMLKRLTRRIQPRQASA